MECIVCDKKIGKNILFENEHLIVALAAEPSVNGHIQIFPKEHYTILEQVPDDTLSSLINAANKVSIVLFELMKVHGTNIIINNGVPAGQKIPHFSIDILPRRTEDNLKLDWALKQAAPEALESVHRIIEEGMSKPEEKPITFEQKSERVPEKLEIKKEDPAIGKDKNEPQEKKSNYYHQLFERIP